MADEKPRKEVKMTGQDKADMDKLKFPEELGNGPIKKRWITDVFFGIFFFLFCIGMFAAAIFGFAKGDPRILLIGWDSDQNGCGYSAETMDYGLLYWPQMPDAATLQSIQNGNTAEALKLLNYGVCVKSCPNGDSNNAVECKPTTFMTESSYYKDGGCQHYPNRNSVSWGTPYRYDTKSTVGHFCVPDGAGYADDNPDTLQAFKDAFFNSVYGETAGQWAYNTSIAWPLLIISVVFAVIFGYLYLYVIRLLGGLIIWISFGIIVATEVGAGLYTYFYLRPQYETGNPTYDYLAYGSYALWGLAGVTVILLLCCYNAVKLGIAIFKCTAKYVQETMEIFLLPAWSTAVTTVWFGLWFGSAIFIFSVGTPTPRVGYEFITEVMWDPYVRWIFLYHVFGLFWINAFIIGSTQFIIGASAVIWYFECNTDSKGKGSVTTGFHWLVRYHLGSLAFGSFVIAVCEMIRFCFEYYRRKLGSMSKEIKIVKILLCVTGYLLWLMEKCVKYMTKNAYIQIALTNEGFCKAAWNGYALMIKHAHRFGFGNSIGTIYLVFGCMCISATTSFTCYMILTNSGSWLEVTDPIPPTVVIGIVSGTIGALFLSIFSFSSDAILQAFLLDEELRFLGGNRPEVMQEFAIAMKKRGQGSCEC